MSHPSPPHPHSWGSGAPSPALLPNPPVAEHRHSPPAPPDLLRFILDPRVATWAKILAALSLAYAIVPIDLIPDLVPILGWLDDAGILTVAMVLLTRAWSQYRASAPAGPGPAASAPAAAGDSRSVVPTADTTVDRK